MTELELIHATHQHALFIQRAKRQAVTPINSYEWQAEATREVARKVIGITMSDLFSALEVKSHDVTMDKLKKFMARQRKQGVFHLEKDGHVCYWMMA